jgi:Ion transport protein
LYTSRCRFLTSSGVYKINDNLKFSCHPGVQGQTCPDGFQCLNNNSPEILLRGMDQNDSFRYTLSFSNILESLLYIFKILTNDGWSDAFMILMHSDLSSTMILLLFLPSIILSILMHGLIVSNFFNTISHIKKMDFEALRKSKGVEKFALGFMQLLNKNRGKSNDKTSWLQHLKSWWSYLTTPYMTVGSES